MASLLDRIFRNDKNAGNARTAAGKIEYTTETITTAVIEQMATTTDPRLKTIMANGNSDGPGRQSGWCLRDRGLHWWLFRLAGMRE